MTTDSAPNFIRDIVQSDIEANKNTGNVVTRFPPEPNGYLHIGHAKSICLNFGIAKSFNGHCNLRFDDTNPEKESQEYMDSIKKDVAWLGFEWANLHHTSDYFEPLYNFAVELIKNGKAYVESLSSDEIREYRGNLTQPGKESPYRNRSVEENLELFQKMREGQFKDGEHVLRARIDMSAANINMRDPILYRIRHVTHHRTGDTWCIYPMYDYAHCISDALEKITHSLCTLEFEDHRPLYDWILDQLDVPSHPQQIEFARLSLEYTVMSKRKLQQLVQDNLVNGWDDPRMPTISGMRRRGYPAAAIRHFCERIGITKKDSTIEMGVLENAVREQLDAQAPRAMGVLQPLKVVITTWPEDKQETFTASNHPNKPEMGQRDIPFTRTLYIEQEDFMEDAPKKFFRLSLDKEVRLRNSYIIKCDKVIKDADGHIIELHCSHDPDTLGKKPEGRKVKGVIHWVSADHAIDAEIRSYDRLFNAPNPAGSEDFTAHLNPDSLKTLHNAKLEPSLEHAKAGDTYQFERQGYFCLDPSSSAGKPVFNRTVTLRDTWAKVEKS